VRGDATSIPLTSADGPITRIWSLPVQETPAARGNLAVAYEAAGDPGPGHPLMPG